MSALLLPALAAGSSGQGAPYVDDVFSTYLYTGNGSTQTIGNGIDLAGKGGLTWLKNRTSAGNHYLFDTVRGALNELNSNNTESSAPLAGSLTAFLSDGFSIGNSADTNQSGQNYASWTFRRAPRFFDVVSWLGNGDAGREIPHSLGVAPAMVIIKEVSYNPIPRWVVSHKPPNGSVYYLYLDSGTGTVQDNVLYNGEGYCYIQASNSKSIFIYQSENGSIRGINESGRTYVAYIFAHDPSAEGIIQCGRYTGNGSATGPTVTLGWEPQYLMIKNATGAVGSWQIIDSMRGMPVGSADATLQANLSNAESSVDYVSPTATGFQVTSTSSEVNTSGAQYIYLVIRSPNRPPTSGAEVYNAIARTGTGAAATVTGVGFAPDLILGAERPKTYAGQTSWLDRTRGWNKELASHVTATENTYSSDGISSVNTDGYSVGADVSFGVFNKSGKSLVSWLFRRAAGFFDVVCDTGTGAVHAIAHNLTKAPELIIRKSRSAATQWEVWHSALATTEKLVLNSNAAKATDTAAWNSVLPTATQFTVGTGANVNANAATFVTYLFATLAGISKVGSYTGNGSSQTIDCGFSTGARFFLVKATSTTGSWWVYDSARGIVSAADPALQLNSTAAEITSADAVDPASVGIIVNQEATCSINATGVSYIFLAIA